MTELELLKAENLQMREALREIENYLNWNSDELSGDNLIGDGKLTARYQEILQVTSRAIYNIRTQKLAGRIKLLEEVATKAKDHQELANFINHKCTCTLCEALSKLDALEKYE